MDAYFLDNLERSLAAHLKASLGVVDGANVKPGRRSGVVEPRPAIGIAWLSWTPRRTSWGGTWLAVTIRIYVYSPKQEADEQQDHFEEGRLHLATLLSLTDEGTIPLFDYRQEPPMEMRQIEVLWNAGTNPPEPQARSRSETWFDVIARVQEG
jgi:hypothetical protein